MCGRVKALIFSSTDASTSRSAGKIKAPARLRGKQTHSLPLMKSQPAAGAAFHSGFLDSSSDFQFYTRRSTNISEK